jgi:adenine-specific DNA-methyltransferase
MIMRKRLIDLEAKPFLYQAIGDYQVEAAKATLGAISALAICRRSCCRSTARCPCRRRPTRSATWARLRGGLGGRRGSKTLVLADSPNKLTGAATLKKAIAQRDNLLGGWDRVVVLGWNFEPALARPSPR